MLVKKQQQQTGNLNLTKQRASSEGDCIKKNVDCVKKKKKKSFIF